MLGHHSMQSNSEETVFCLLMIACIAHVTHAYAFDSVNIIADGATSWLLRAEPRLDPVLGG